MTRHEFTNRLRSLHNIDKHQVPELTDAQWVKFRDDPPRFMIRAGQEAAEAIWREVEKRQAPVASTHGVFATPKRGGMAQLLGTMPSREEAETMRDYFAEKDGDLCHYAVMPVSCDPSADPGRGALEGVG
jgi:hypothetical protein